MSELKWVLREVLLDDGEPMAHREPQQNRRAALDEVHQSLHEEYHGTTGRNETIRLAKEAGASTLHGGETALFGAAAIERFAALVAAAERDACALICDQLVSDDNPFNDARLAAEAIRARGDA